MHRTMCGGRAHKVGLIHTWAMYTGLNVRARSETDTQMMSRELFPFNSHGKSKNFRVLWSVTKITLFAPIIEDGFPI